MFKNTTTALTAFCLSVLSTALVAEEDLYEADGRPDRFRDPGRTGAGPRESLRLRRPEGGELLDLEIESSLETHCSLGL